MPFDPDAWEILNFDREALIGRYEIQRHLRPGEPSVSVLCAAHWSWWYIHRQIALMVPIVVDTPDEIPRHIYPAQFVNLLAIGRIPGGDVLLDRADRKARPVFDWLQQAVGVDLSDEAWKVPPSSHILIRDESGRFCDPGGPVEYSRAMIAGGWLDAEGAPVPRRRPATVHTPTIRGY